MPCEWVVYEPMLSYAQLSHLNVQRFVAGSLNVVPTECNACQGQLNLCPSEKEVVTESCEQLNQLIVYSFRQVFTYIFRFSLNDGLGGSP